MGMEKDCFTFRAFSIRQDKCAMKVGTDGVLLGAWAPGGTRILDIGTGTGLIALIMAQRFGGSMIDAIDIDADACEQARQNVAASPFPTRIHVWQSDLQHFCSPKPYDAIVCNPPFFVNALRCPNSKRTMARHTDTLSPRDLFAHAYRLLADGGTLALIILTDQADGFVAESIIAGFFEKDRVRIKTTERKAAKRLLLSFTKKSSTVRTDTEQVLFYGQQKSEWYHALTADLYL